MKLSRILIGISNFLSEIKSQAFFTTIRIFYWPSFSINLPQLLLFSNVRFQFMEIDLQKGHNVIDLNNANEQR